MKILLVASVNSSCTVNSRRDIFIAGRRDTIITGRRDISNGERLEFDCSQIQAMYAAITLLHHLAAANFAVLQNLDSYASSLEKNQN